ncbi:MAG: hypothetical protein KO206_01490 [Methanomicrobiaceae archaeon]|nr:hypothetical protein [Methanomicrobiaceae archaeon]
MADERWSRYFRSIIADLGSSRVRIDGRGIREPVNTYLVRSLDGTALRFCMPILLNRHLPEPVRRDPAGADGAIGVLIEAIKSGTRTDRALGPIAGAGTRFPRHCGKNIEPVTLIASPGAIGTDLWRPDHENRLTDQGIRLLARGGVPYPGPPSPGTIRAITEDLQALLEGIEKAARSVPDDRLVAAWELSIDQKALRSRLPELGLVSFIGDGVRPARRFTDFRCHHRIAGPKEGVNIPFRCPKELDPIEVEVQGSGRIVTGLGLRRREIFAITGSNAQGKSTLLEGVVAGQDDHAAGDGREYLVSVRGIARAEAGGRYLAGADVSLFFRSLPPGLAGEPEYIYGQGSGSLVMAHEIQTALRKGAPLLIFDEDRAATNLLIPSCLHTGEVTPLSTLVATRREAFGETALLFAASSLDILTAGADRILLLDRHEAGAITPGEFRKRLVRYLQEVGDHLNAGG